MSHQKLEISNCRFHTQKLEIREFTWSVTWSGLALVLTTQRESPVFVCGNDNWKSASESRT